MKIQIEFEEKEKIPELDKREIETKISRITDLLGEKIPQNEKAFTGKEIKNWYVFPQG